MRNFDDQEVLRGEADQAEGERPELLDWQKEILTQRLQDAEAHPCDWVSWDEAKKRLEGEIHGHE